MTTNIIQERIDTAGPYLLSSARRLRRDLEELQERHDATPGLTPDGRQAELDRVLADGRQHAQGPTRAIVREIQEARRLGNPIPDGAEDALTELSALSRQIVAVTNLDDANALVATLTN